MPDIRARVGGQNVIRVLSNATSAPTKLATLNDVVSTYIDQDGMILVWDLPTQKFIMTSVIDSASSTVEGIAYFTNTTDSSLPTNGALIVSGGVGIGKNLNVGLGLTVTGLTTLDSGTTINGPLDVNDTVNITGIATFGSDLDINAAVDILNSLVVNGATSLNNTLTVSGDTTLASSGGITTTGGDLTVAGDLTVQQNLLVQGSSDFIGNAVFRGGTIGIGDGVTDDINVGGEFVSNLVPNDDATYDIGISTQRWRNGYYSGLLTSTNLNISGVATFQGNQDIFGDVIIDGNLGVTGVITSGIVSVTEGLYYEPGDVNGGDSIAYFDIDGKLVSSASTTAAIDTSNYILTTQMQAGIGTPIWTTTIDGGEF